MFGEFIHKKSRIAFNFEPLFNPKKLNFMKKMLIPFGFAVLALVGASFTTLKPTTAPIENVKLGGFVKIVNDTKQDIRIYTGSAHVTLYHNGGSTSVSCEAGKGIYTSDGSKKGKLIFTIDDSMCGKTVRLSAYL